ncbi:MAG: hypothetical protein WC690_09355, partial [bacterium]
MSFDLGITEESLVGFLNGATPEGDRLVRRIATLLYQERQSLMPSFLKAALGWEPIHTIPEPLQNLVTEARSKAIVLFGGTFPRSFEIEGHGPSGQLHGSPLHRLFQKGDVKFGGKWTPRKFIEDLMQLLFEVERVDGGYRYAPLQGMEAVRINNLIADFVAQQLDWTPIEEIPERMRPLVTAARERAIALYGGLFPSEGFDIEGHGPSGAWIGSPLHRLFQKGDVKFGGNWTPRKFIEDLMQLLFEVERVDGGYRYAPLQGMEAVRINNLIADFVTQQLDWKPIEEIPELMRPLVTAAREKAIALYGGKIPSTSFDIEGRGPSGDLYGSPLHRLLQNGEVKFVSSSTPRKFIDDLIRFLFEVERVDGGYRYMPLQEMEAARINNLIADVVIQQLDWTPIEEIPEPRQPLVAAAREKAIALYGGQIPSHSFDIVGRGPSGQLHESPLHRLFQKGEVKFEGSSTPRKFIDDLMRFLFEVERVDGGYRYAPLQGMEAVRINNLIADFVTQQLDWTPIEEIPEPIRPLVTAAREKAIALYGGKIPSTSFDIEGRGPSGSLVGSPLRALISNGSIQYNNRNTPRIFFCKLRDHLFGVEHAGVWDPGKESYKDSHRAAPVAPGIEAMLLRYEAEANDAWGQRRGYEIVMHPGGNSPRARDEEKPARKGRHGGKQGKGSPSAPSSAAPVTPAPAAPPAPSNASASSWDPGRIASLGAAMTCGASPDTDLTPFELPIELLP